MNVQRATLVVIVGVGVSFVVRTVGTLAPQIFENKSVASLGVIVHLVVSLALANYFLAFRRRYTESSQPTLRSACIVATIGSLASSFLHIKSLFLLAGRTSLPVALLGRELDATVPLLSSTAVLAFFIVFRREMGDQERRALGPAARSAMVGFLIYTVLHTVVLLNYFHSGRFQWVTDFAREASLWILPVLVLAVLLILRFFLSFYRFAATSASQD